MTARDFALRSALALTALATVATSYSIAGIDASDEIRVELPASLRLTVRVSAAAVDFADKLVLTVEFPDENQPFAVVPDDPDKPIESYKGDARIELLDDCERGRDCELLYTIAANGSGQKTVVADLFAHRKSHDDFPPQAAVEVIFDDE